MQIRIPYAMLGLALVAAAPTAHAQTVYMQEPDGTIIVQHRPVSGCHDHRSDATPSDGQNRHDGADSAPDRPPSHRGDAGEPSALGVMPPGRRVMAHATIATCESGPAALRCRCARAGPGSDRSI